MPRLFASPGRSQRPRAPLLAGGAIFLLCVWGFFEIAEDYPEGKYHRFDTMVLRGLRTAEHPAVPRGPLWLKDTMRDVSALGSAAVLIILVSGLAGYLLLQGRKASALAVALASAGGAALNVLLKSLSARPRPDIVPHLTEVTSSSFPSGHSMLSAIIYLSAGAMLARHSTSRAIEVYVLVLAAGLTFAVGFSRIYLGVHYPTDVLAGWIAGIVWTLLCLAAQAWCERPSSHSSAP